VLALIDAREVKGCPGSRFRAATDGLTPVDAYVWCAMKSSIRELITIGAMVGLLVAATFGLAGFAGHLAGPAIPVVLPTPTPDPNPQPAAS
jgi:hypothetical protein